MSKSTAPAAVTSGRVLVQKLRDSGTGEAKLAVARRRLKQVFDDEGRIASAEEILAALHEDLAVPDGTLEKARRIVDTGTADPPVERTDPIEDQLADVDPDPAVVPAGPGPTLAAVAGDDLTTMDPTV